MSDPAALGQPYKVCAVRFERLLPGPLERVWAHLTETGKLSAWYGEDGAIEPREGGAVRLMGGHIRGVVTQWRPHARLAYTWNVFGPGEAASPYPESYLTFDLTPEGDQVRLVLAHLPVLDQFEAQNMMGWHTFLDMLGGALRGEPLEARPAYMQRNAALYGVDLENLAR
ncbi:MAG: SRPBCC domain-containing protein [Proteobacteria bacterium]|nr:SRPBCC domain-containing protein [Pseudomonadota bacterium]